MNVEFLGLVFCQIIYPQANTPRKCAILSQFHTLADTLALPISVPPVHIEGIRRFLTTRKHTHIFLQSGQSICTGRALSQSYEGIQILDPPRQIQGLQA